METHLFHYPQSFSLACGETLPEFQLAYATAGRLNAQGDNVIWVCHALTANAQVAEWWPNLFGPQKLLDPDHYFIVCANMLGSCYGSTDALSPNPRSGQPYYHDFPLLTNRDIVRAFDLLREALGIEQIQVLMGGSLGGQQCLEWAIQQPDRIKTLIPIATNARHSPWGIAFNESQRMAIEADPTWAGGGPQAGLKGMWAARSVALLSYRSYATYAQTQQDPHDEALEGYRATTYQRYQGEKLVQRFHAYAYWTLSKAMDSHRVGRGRGGMEAALACIQARTLVIGVSSDGLFPVAEQKLLATLIPKAQYAEIDSIYGHDGFLIEADQLTAHILAFLAV